MKARIVKEFHDKADFRIVYKVNSLVDFSESRFTHLQSLGLVEAVDVKPVVVEEKVSDENPQEIKVERKRRTRRDD